MGDRISPARKAAGYVLSRYRRFEAWSTQTLQAARDKYSLSEKDAALCARLCLSVLQNAALCDYYIDCYSSRPSVKLDPRVLDILRLGTVQILFMDKIPDRAAVDQAVEMAKENGGHAAGLVNAVLHRISENKASLPEIPDPGTPRELSIRYSHPLWLCEKLFRERGYAFAADFLRASNTEPGLTLSVNLCRTDPVSLVRSLADSGLEAQIIALCPVSVHISASGAVESIPGFADGQFFVQDAAAACSVFSASPRIGSRILDLCAAPGGKSLLCASLTGDSAEILSCDLHEKKLALIRRNAERLGFSGIQTSAMNAAEPREELYDRFDLVIADVPCSGLGVIRKKPEIRYKDFKSISALPPVQLSILRGAAKCVAPGGELLYSTCTVLREENEAVIEAFSPQENGFEVEEMRTIWPQEFGTDGFFFCRMRRHDDR